MKQFFLLLISISITIFSFAQNVDSLLKEAQNTEYTLQEPAALEKYKAVLVVAPNNMKALIKTTELSVAIGTRQTDKKEKLLYYQSAMSFAERAIAIDSNSADANYITALVYSKMTDIEKENKKISANIKATKLYVDKALHLNNNHAKADYLIGNWHFEMVNLAGVKKTAVKLFYGSLPKSSLDSAIFFMEKCKTLDQYYMLNYMTLAKAYIQNDKPTKAIEILQQLIKLPLRTADDAALKEEGKKMLTELQ
ncbi:MAG: hypothetical protein KF781_07615 [Chitinophagaceae bacterium]|nr:hypothetical protein [Chitinophagaceae bacterium]MCW5905622.1 hypothetical protein [Chitinophagaceae bacterium]